MKASTHPDQAKRLATLAGFDLLDSAPETPFDDVVRFLTRMCDVPVALVSLVDEHRQWFKARSGIDVDETPIGHSICAHAILGTEILEVEDTALDPRTADNPLCQGEDAFRFYAGAPLVAPDGMPIGSLCVMDRRPRRLSALQREALTVLADQVMAQIRLRKALHTEDTMRREVDHRVGNSLQLLMALLRHETRQLNNDEAKETLDRFGRRINSVARVHEQLHRSAAGHVVPLDQYLSDLAQNLSETAPAGVTVSGVAPPIGIAWRDATMVGTLFNEAVANAFKHAFPGGRGGTVRYAAEAAEDRHLRFICEDDGVGVEHVPEGEEHGLGTTLGEIIGMELEGELKVEALAPGTRVSLTFQPREIHPMQHDAEIASQAED